MSSYPKFLQYYLSRLNNFSRQKYRIQTLANTTFNAGDQIVLQLPEGLLDMTTLTLQGRVSTSGGLAQGVYTPDIEALIDGVYIEVGGIAIQTGFTNYGDLWNIIKDYTLQDKKDLRRVLQLDTAPLVPLSNFQCSNVPFACYNWLGFLGSVKMLDTTIIPPVKVYFRLAPNSVLGQFPGNASTNTYQLTNVSATIDIMDISDGVYYPMVANRLAQSPIEIPFQGYTTVVGGMGAATSTTRFSTSTDCLEGVIGTLKPAYYLDNGYNSNAARSSYYTRCGSNTTVTTSQFFVNGIPYPSIPLDNAQGEIFYSTAHAFNQAQDAVGATNSNMNSLTAWQNHFFVHGHSFGIPAQSDDDHRLVGLSGRGNQLLGSWNLTGTGSNAQPLIFLKHRSVLRIGSGKTVELIL